MRGIFVKPQATKCRKFDHFEKCFKYFLLWLEMFGFFLEVKSWINTSWVWCFTWSSYYRHPICWLLWHRSSELQVNMSSQILCWPDGSNINPTSNSSDRKCRLDCFFVFLHRRAVAGKAIKLSGGWRRCFPKRNCTRASFSRIRFRDLLISR